MLVPGFLITGAPAIIIILVIIVLLILGVVTFLRMTARGAKRLVNHGAESEPAAREDIR